MDGRLALGADSGVPSKSMTPQGRKRSIVKDGSRPQPAAQLARKHVIEAAALRPGHSVICDVSGMSARSGNRKTTIGNVLATSKMPFADYPAPHLLG